MMRASWRFNARHSRQKPSRLNRATRLTIAFVVTLFVTERGQAQIATNLDALKEMKPTLPAVSHKSKTSGARGKARSGTVQAPRSSTTEPPGNHATKAPEHAAPVMPPSQQQAHQMVGPPPNVPPAPPKTVVIGAPAVFVQTHPPVAPTPVIPEPKAKTEVIKTTRGLKLLYAPQQSSIGLKAFQTLQTYAHSLAKKPQLRITILSWASGQADDPSVPRRIALARALDVRSILINAGVATTRIYPRAEGLPPKTITPPDTLELRAEGAAPAPPSDAQYPLKAQVTSR